MSLRRPHHTDQDRHLDDRELLRCLDGEAAQPEHLERCWTCRSRLRELEQVTGEIVRLREEYLLPEMAEAPPFSRLLLRAKANADGGASRTERVRQMRERIHWPAIAGIAAVLALMAVVWPSGRVSAHEALTRSADAERMLVSNVVRPVLRQTLRVRSIAARSGQTRETTYQSWVEWPSGRWRTSGGDAQLLKEMETVWRANRLRPDLPLSAVAFSHWADEADLLDYADGVLKADSPAVQPQDAQTDTRVVSAELRLRTTDWHVVAQKLVLASRTYEVSETGIEVSAFNAGHRSIFDPGPAAPAVPHSTHEPAAEPLAATASTRIHPLLSSATPAATLPGDGAGIDLDELEVEVWHAIHREGCHRGCDLEVTTRHPHVVVSGTTAKRAQRDQLVRALRSIDRHAQIEVRVRALDGAVATRAVAPDQRTSIHATPLPIETFLSSQPAPGGQRVMVASLANQVILLADQAEQEAKALSRLIARFPAPRYGSLPTQSRWLLDAMVLEHVQALRLGVASLQAVQQPVFAQLPPTDVPVAGEADLQQDPLEAYQAIHALLHGLYAGASDTAPLEGVREVADRLTALATVLADEDLPDNIFSGSIHSPRSPR